MTALARARARAPALLAVLLVAASGSLAGSVSAAPPKVSAEKKNTAKVVKQLMFEGQRALVKKDFAVALGKFRAADDAEPSPYARLGEARALVGLGQLAAAELMYNSTLHDARGKAIAHPPPGAVKEEEALALALPYVTLVVKGADPKTVTASIDGEVIPGGSWSTQHPVDPGAHFARAEAPGLETVETPFKAVEGEAQTVTLTFHGAAPTTSTTTLVAAEPAKTEGTPSASPPRRIAGWILAGTGGAGLVFGGVMAGLAAKKHSSLESSCPDSVCPQSASGDLSSYHTLGTLSTVGLIAGGAVAAGGLVLVFLPSKDAPAKEGSGPDPSSARGLRVSPLVAPGLVGTAGAWTF